MDVFGQDCYVGFRDRDDEVFRTDCLFPKSRFRGVIGTIDFVNAFYLIADVVVASINRGKLAIHDILPFQLSLSQGVRISVLSKYVKAC
jgi:hypothetical protein